MAADSFLLSDMLLAHILVAFPHIWTGIQALRLNLHYADSKMLSCRVTSQKGKRYRSGKGPFVITIQIFLLTLLCTH